MPSTNKIQNKKCILSIDGGASTTKAGVINSKTGEVLKEIKINKPFNNYSIQTGNYKATLKEIISQAKEFNITVFIFGLAGLDTEKEKKTAEKKITRYLNNKITSMKNIKTCVLNDIELVLYNCPQAIQNRIAIIAGTGSNCVGIATNGEEVKAGGLDYILTDQGGGYWIGYNALKLAVKSLDGRGLKTELGREVLKTLKAKDVFELKHKIYDNDFSKKDFAKLSYNVVKCYKQKRDRVAEKILKKASYELFLHVHAVAKKLNIQEFTVIEAGSIFKIKYVKKGFEKQVLKNYDKATFHYPADPSYFGGYNYLKTNKQKDNTIK